MALAEHFSIPTTFWYERVQSVTHSFGHEELDNGAFREESPWYLVTSLIQSRIMVSFSVQSYRAQA